MTNPDIHQAKQWAKEAYEQKSNGVIIDGIALATARVIQSLPDRWVDAEKVAELADDMANWCFPDGPSTTEIDYRRLIEIIDGFTGRINDLLTPPLPTLAGLSDEERLKTKWGQADHATGRCVILTPHVHTREGDGRSYDSATLMWPTGRIATVPHSEVTPRPDLPRLEWPSLSLSGESEDVSLETETNTEGGAPGVYDDGGPLLPGSQRINLVGARKLPPLADTIPDQVVAKDACNNTVPQSGDVWRAVWLDRAGILVVGKGIHHESGSLQGYFFRDHDPQVRWVGTDEVDLTKLVLRRGQ